MCVITANIYYFSATLYRQFDASVLPNISIPQVVFMSPSYPSESVVYQENFYAYLVSLPGKTYTMSFDDYALPLPATIEVSRTESV